MLVCHYQVSLDDFSILVNSGNNYVLELKESLFIVIDNAALSSTISSVSLYCFKSCLNRLGVYAVDFRTILFMI